MDDQGIAIRAGFNLAGPGASINSSQVDYETGSPDMLLEGHHAKPEQHADGSQIGSSVQSLMVHDLGFGRAPAQSMQLLVTSDSRHWQAVHGALLTHQILRSPDGYRVAGGRTIPTKPGESLSLSGLQVLADADS